jgi:hypothetical protein
MAPLLKGKFPHSKRNRRMDHLLNTLLNDVLPYYALKQRRQDFGFEGINIEVKKRQDIVKKSKEYVPADIEVRTCLARLQFLITDLLTAY